jgi:hypothetical protein
VASQSAKRRGLLTLIFMQSQIARGVFGVSAYRQENEWKKRENKSGGGVSQNIPVIVLIAGIKLWW